MLLNKADTVDYALSEIKLPDGDSIPAYTISLQNDERERTLKLLESKLTQAKIDDVMHPDFLVTRHRHRLLFSECLECLRNFQQEGIQPDMACEELRMALKALQKITGHIDVEEVLDVLFQDFCIGK